MMRLKKKPVMSTLLGLFMISPGVHANMDDAMMPLKITVKKVSAATPAMEKAMEGFRNIQLTIVGLENTFKENHQRYLTQPTTTLDPTAENPGEIRIYPQTRNQQICEIGNPPEPGVSLIGNLTRSIDYAQVKAELAVGDYSIFVNDVKVGTAKIDRPGDFDKDSPEGFLTINPDLRYASSPEVAFVASENKRVIEGTEKDNENQRCTLELDFSSFDKTSQIGATLQFTGKKRIDTKDYTTRLKPVTLGPVNLDIRSSTSCENEKGNRPRRDDKLTPQKLRVANSYTIQSRDNAEFDFYESYTVSQGVMDEKILDHNLSKSFTATKVFTKDLRRTCTFENQPILYISER